MFKRLRQNRARKRFGRAWDARDSAALKAAAEAMIAAFPDDHKVQNDLGVAWLDLEQPATAEPYFRRSIELNDNAIDQNNLGRALLALGRYMEARAAFQKSVKFDPSDLQPQFNLIVLLRDEGKVQEAEAALFDFVAVFPNHAESQNNLGTTWEKRGEKENALACYSHATVCMPTFVIARLNLIRLLCVLGRFPESVPHLEALAKMGMSIRVDRQGKDVQIDINGELFFRGPA